MPVAINGAVIERGDLVIGDGGGVLCVSYGSARALLEVGHKNPAEAEIIAPVEAGNYPVAWVDAALRKGVAPASCAATALGTTT